MTATPQKKTDFDILMHSGTVINGAGKMLHVDGEFVGWQFPTNDGLHHVLDDNGHRLNVFATAAEADDFSRRHWNKDGTVSEHAKTINLQ